MNGKYLKGMLLAAAFGLFAAACSDNPTPFEQAPPEDDPGGLITLFDHVATGECMGNDVLTYNLTVPPNQKASWGNTAIPNGNYCTANDIYLANATVTHVYDEDLGQFVPVTGPITCVEGESFDVMVVANLAANSEAERTDIGVWVAQGGPTQTQAVDGACNHYYLTPGVDGAVSLDDPADACGDVSASLGVLATLDLDVLTLQCIPNENFKVEVPACVGWTVPGQDRYCPHPEGESDPINFRMGTVPGNTSKCNCEPFELDIVVVQSALLEVRKELDPADDPGRFNLFIDDVMHATNVGDGGTTGPIEVGAGTSAEPGADHTFAETAFTGTSLDDYVTTWECRDEGGAAGSRGSGTGPGPETLTLMPDDYIICTFTNVVKPSYLTLEKTVINDDGGTATADDFQAYIDGEEVDWFETYQLPRGSHTASEDVVTGYTAGSWGGDCAADGSVELNPGESKTCTITNDDQPATLTLEKTVINDDGGTATADDFQAYIDGSPVPWGVAQSVGAGSFTASEDVVTGYTAGSWGGDCAADGSVSLANGEHKTCTITNDDDPAYLILEKTVINDDGGTATADDFQAYIDGSPVPWGVPQSVGAGSFTASEDVVAGYDAGPWGGDCAADGSVSLANGETKTCTITNDDQPAYLILEKTVINDDGGTATADDFQAYIDGSPVPWFVAQSVGAGTFVASEDVVAGYTAGSWGGDCAADGSVTLALGETKTCTITNDDDPQEESETAWAANGLEPGSLRYTSQGNWATYVQYQGFEGTGKVVNFYAGQTEYAGTVTFSAVGADVAGMVTITIDLAPGFSYEAGSAIAVQDYASAPSGNPSPGLFDHKFQPGDPIYVPANNFYGVHAVVLN
jgi:hypothetical protein